MQSGVNVLHLNFLLLRFRLPSFNGKVPFRTSRSLGSARQSIILSKLCAEVVRILMLGS